MSEGKANKALAALGGALLPGALVAAYANHFHNSFDSSDALAVINDGAIREILHFF